MGFNSGFKGLNIWGNKETVLVIFYGIHIRALIFKIIKHTRTHARTHTYTQVYVLITIQSFFYN